MPVFVDANILVYAEDRDAGDKYVIARNLVADLWRSGEGVLSVQVLQEFFVNVTRKVPRPLGTGQALEIVEDVPDDVFAAGNPCRVIRPLTAADRPARERPGA